MNENVTFQQKMRVMNKLFSIGCDTEKKLQQLTIEDILRIPSVTIPDMNIILEIQKQTKSNKLFCYLGNGKDARTNVKYSQQSNSEEVT